MIATKRLAEVFVEVADTLVDDFDLIEFMQMLTIRCAELFDVTAAGLLLADHRGQLHLMAASDERTEMLELFQVQAEEGPCQDCYRTGSPVSESDMAEAADRWPRFAPRAVAAGFGAVHAFPMRLRGEVFGALNLFSSGSGEMDELDKAVVQALADVATMALLQERSIRRSEVLTEQLQGALNSRIAIEQAKGALSQIHGCSTDEGFDMLRAYARANDRPLTEVATQVTTDPGNVAELTTPAPLTLTSTKVVPEQRRLPPRPSGQFVSTASESEGASGSLRTTVSSGSGKDVIALAGEMDVATAPKLAETIHRLLARGRSNIVVDLGGVTFFDLAAIGVLTTATDDVSRAGGSLWVTHNERCMRLLMITDQLHRLNITDTRTARIDQGIRER